MKTPHEQTSRDPQQAQRKPSFLHRGVTFITATSADAFVLAPCGERWKVYAVSLTILLIAFLAMLGIGTALDIARGNLTSSYLIACVLVGLLILALEVSQVRNLWESTARRALRERVYLTEAPPSRLRRKLNFAIRMSFSVIMGLTIGGFLGLFIFEKDLIAHIAQQNREDNKPAYAAATARVQAQIDAQRTEIARLGAQADAIINDARSTNSANQTTATRERQTLSQERAQVQQNVIELQKVLNLHKHNMSAEELGQTTYNGAQTIAGKGRRYAHAARMVNDYSQQLRAAEARLAQIDTALARIPIPDASPDISAQMQNRLDQISRSRARTMSALDRLLANRDETVRVSAESDSAYVPMPQGLIVRGKALAELMEDSPWVRARILLISAFIIALDLIGLAVIYTIPVPLGLAMAEVMETDAVIEHVMAEAEQRRTGFHQTIQEARAQRAAVENTTDEHIQREQRKTRTRREFYNWMHKYPSAWDAKNGNAADFNTFH